MEVEIILKECIKPSSPTPHYLRTHKLSLLDQFAPSFYVPIVLYYPIDDHNTPTPVKDFLATKDEKLQLLKQSLSQTLSRFYPLAGKIRDNLSIDCHDEGVYYVEARTKSHLSEFLSHPDISQIEKFLPADFKWNESTAGAHVAMIQVTVFGCGGLTIGIFVAHMVADGIAMSTFLKDWGVNARGCCDGAVSPDFTIAPHLFPQNDSFPKESSMMGMCYPFFKLGKHVLRRFVFNASALATLKAKATTSRIHNPTRVEVVSALIWKCTMAALKEKSGVQKPSLLTHSVNLRRRAGPPFSEYSMGNLFWLAVAQCTAETELGHLVHELRRAITKINGELLITALEGDQGSYKCAEAIKEVGEVMSSAAFANNGVDYLGFSSWHNFGLYEVDFGWGKPMWVTPFGGTSDEEAFVLNFVILMETRGGDGIEAWIRLEEQDMTLLECDKELAFAVTNPSPLQVVE